jgi:two-component system sensor histidine kinase KdpD
MTFSGIIESQLREAITKGNSESSSITHWKSALLLTLFIVTLTSLVAVLLVNTGFPTPETLSVLFVIPVLFSGIFYTLGMALLAALISVLAYNFVLLPPVWHIGLFEAENFTKMLVLGVVAVIASAMSAQIRVLMRDALQRERVLSGVYALSQDMLGIANISDMRKAAESKLASLLASHVIILLKEDFIPPNEPLQLCLTRSIPTGNGTHHYSSDASLYLPMSTSIDAIGVIKITGDASQPPVLERFSSKILATLAAQTASALEKAKLAEEHELKRQSIEREKFLSALLSSVSHDLKTPLVTIIGAFSSLKDITLIREHYLCRETVAGGLEEAQKLNRFISNLVEISRLESGMESLRREPVHLRDMVASALKSLHPIIGKQHFSIHAAPDFPFLNVNPALMELVFLNLLENAVKYGPAGGEIKIIAHAHSGQATIDFDDDGVGIPPNERQAIFVKFYRAKLGDRKIAGTGLGLYICKGIVTAHGGSIEAIDPHDGKGACVRITLPKEALIPIALEEEIEEN